MESGKTIAAARPSRQGTFKGADSPSNISTEQMEISRLKAELARVKMERDILGRATACFAKGLKRVRLYLLEPACLADLRTVLGSALKRGRLP